MSWPHFGQNLILDRLGNGFPHAAQKRLGVFTYSGARCIGTSSSKKVPAPVAYLVPWCVPNQRFRSVTPLYSSDNPIHKDTAPMAMNVMAMERRMLDPIPLIITNISNPAGNMEPPSAQTTPPAIKNFRYGRVGGNVNTSLIFLLH